MDENQSKTVFKSLNVSRNAARAMSALAVWFARLWFMRRVVTTRF